jgi:hypothetical protein
VSREVKSKESVWKKSVCERAEMSVIYLQGTLINRLV